MAETQRPAGRTHKSRGRVSDQQRRREIALARQKSLREDYQNHARQLAFLSSNYPTLVEDPDEAFAQDATEPPFSTTQDKVPEFSIAEMDLSGSWSRIDKDGQVIQEDLMEDGGEKENSLPESLETGVNLNFGGRKAREWYSKQLTIPEWMVDIPQQLSTEWFVMPRPEGLRCLVISCNGSTVSRLSNGRILHRFPSFLPNGARARHVAAPSHVYCILDCIFNETAQTYFILDVMCWKGYSLYNCSSEFRLFWVQSKLEETGASNPPSALHRYPFCTVPVFECTLEGLQLAYGGQVPFERDGLLFYNRHAHYTLGVTPLVLRWKDSTCSQYVIDTDNNGVVSSNQMVVLELSQGGKLLTCDSPPVELGSMPQDFVQNNEKNWKPGTLLRFSIALDGIEYLENGTFRLNNLKFEGLAHRRGGSADSLSKILFQHAARTDPITAPDLVSTIAMVPSSTSEM